MPLSALLFRRRSETPTTTRPPQRRMHCPPPPAPLPAGAAAVVETPPLLGLKAISGPRSPWEYDRRCVKRSGVYFPSDSVCSPSASAAAAGSEEEDDDDDEEEEERREEEEERCCWASYGRRGVRRLPPPITVVAKALQNRCLVPWVLRRSYEDGGRLVMREVKAEKQDEYLQPTRKGGRLTLKLVHVHERASPATSGRSPPVTAAVPVPTAATARSRRRDQASPKQAMRAPTCHLCSSPARSERCTDSYPTTAPRRQLLMSKEVGPPPPGEKSTRFLTPQVLLSSSLPEANTMGCYVTARPDSPLGMMVAARMPPVHS